MATVAESAAIEIEAQELTNAQSETLPLTTVNFQVRQDEFLGSRSAIDPTLPGAISGPIEANASTEMAQSSASFPYDNLKTRLQTLGDEENQGLAPLENDPKNLELSSELWSASSQVKWKQFEQQQARFERMLAQWRSQSTERLSLLPTQKLPQLSMLVAKAEESLLATANLTIPVARLAAAPAIQFTALAGIPLPSRLPKSVFHALHQVKAGETLDAIAQRYQISGRDLMQANQLESHNLLSVGQELKIPLAAYPDQEVSKLHESPAPSLVEAGTTQFETASKDPYVEQLKADVEKLRQEYQAHYESGPMANSQPVTIASVTSAVERLPSESLAIAPVEAETFDRGFRPPVGETVSPELPPLSSPDPYLPNPETFDGYIWPAKGVITSGYGWRWGRMHRGIDIAAPVGTPILAASSGEVVVAGWNSGGFGNLVKVRHYDGSLTLYAHNSRILVREGQHVKQGQQIAEMGSTGRSTGPHLHFEVHPNGRGAVNPIAYLPKKR